MSLDKKPSAGDCPPLHKALPSPHDEFIAPLLAALQAHASLQRAAAMKAYMRGQFEFFGLATPLRRQLSAGFLRSKVPAVRLLSLAQVLWQRPERECQYIAIDLLARHWQQLTCDDVAALLSLAQQRSWWDSVDGLAGVVGDIIKAASQRGEAAQALMDQALHHDNLWVRRIAMLHQLGWRSATDEQRLFAAAVLLAPEKDYFIRKAIGWALRDYARHAPERVSAFLSAQRQVLSPLSLREAARHLPGDADARP